MRKYRNSTSTLLSLVIGGLIFSGGTTAVVLGAPPPVPPATNRKYVPPPLAITGDGVTAPLKYLTDARGDRVPDYSYAGYRGGGALIPGAPVRVVVSAVPGDNTPRIQAAIDYVASLPLDANGLRGAVLMEKGRFEIAGGLRISASGIVLRGQGAGPDGTTLVATGLDRRTLITVAGSDDRQTQPEQKLASVYFPVNATQLRLANAGGIKVGDTVTVKRPCTYEWIKLLGMENMGGDRHAGNWHEGTRELLWDRTVTAVDGDQFTIDAPITCSIDPAFGVGTVAAYAWPGRISEVGIENLRCESTFSPENPKDENHSWMAITLGNVQDAWVRQVTAEHFVASAVTLWESCKRITVEDCKSLAPISENAGYRRHTFFTAGQQTFFQRCYSEEGRHDFAVGYCAAGPNVFMQCWADRALEDSGPIDSWAAGVLYDNVRIDANALSLYDRSYRGQYAGWSAANCFLWQCTAAVLNCYSPPGANNWAYGAWGTFAGNGNWAASNEFVKPMSLYYAQLAARLGPKMLERAEVLRDDLGDTPSRLPPADLARILAEARKPAPQMQDWIDEMAKRHPIPIDASGAKRVEEVIAAAPKPIQNVTKIRKPLALKNGWLTVGDGVLTGARQEITYWNGGVRPDDVTEAAAKAPMPTRWVPGRYGPGLTEDLNQDTDNMLAGGFGAIEHHYGLWYDVRDADHERVQRMDGDVFPPFYELPFQRSGQGLAWDGLSKYDLLKYNPWYWNRLQSLAQLCQQKGLVLIDENFFQHNILEAGAHFASSPWRTANNINSTGFPEPPMFAGDKRIFMAEQFYDVTHPTRSKIFRAYIRKNLDNFGDDANVIHFTSGEFQGPLHFVQFWLDTIAEWERDTGKHPIIGLSTTKDVQDAILADPVRSKIVSVIDIQYWSYRGNGASAPAGGSNQSPRQAGIGGGNGTSPDQTARAIREYRMKFPDKAVTYRSGTVMPRNAAGWGDLVAGGSLAPVRKLDEKLAKVLPQMRPIDLPGKPAGKWALAEEGKNYLVFSSNGGMVKVDLTGMEGGYVPRMIDLATGAVQRDGQVMKGGGTVNLAMPGNGASVVWLAKESQ